MNRTKTAAAGATEHTGNARFHAQNVNQIDLDCNVKDRGCATIARLAGFISRQAD